ncbi:hypothetical protein ACNOYE_12820 [Nannocystaceae bacterium ST9]
MPEVLARVTGVRGLVLDLDWIASTHASVFTRLISGSGVGATLAHRGGGTHALAIADREAHGLSVGSELSQAGEFRPVSLAPAQLVAIARELGLSTPTPTSPSRTIATGIKMIDVMCPLVEGGATWLIGGHDVGRVKFLEELHLRLAERPSAQTVVFPIVPDYAASIPSTLAAQPGFPPDADADVRSIWLISEAANQPGLAELPLGTTRLVFDPSLPARGCWPAVDVLASRSSAPLEPERLAVVESITALLAWAARARASSTEPRDEGRMAMARALERYLSQPFHSARSLTGMAGTQVPVEVALAGCRAILAGRPPSDGYDFPAAGGG